MGICSNISSGALAVAKIGDFLKWLQNSISQYWMIILSIIIVIVALLVLK